MAYITIPPLGPAVDNTWLLAKGLLDIAVQALDVNVPSTAPAPERSYIYMGEPSYDYPNMLVVYATDPRPSATFPELYPGPILTPVLWVADLNVVLLRPFAAGVQSSGKLDSPELFNANSRQTYADGHAIYWSIFTTLVQLKQTTNCFDYFSFSPLKPIQAEGGSAGWTFVVTTEINGDCSCLAQAPD